MNKLAIPSLLLGVVMIAGAFAFMPVQEASTVHDTVQANTVEINIVDIAATTWDADTVELEVTGNGGDFCIEALYLDSVDADLTNTDTVSVIDMSINNVNFLDVAGASPADVNVYTANADDDLLHVNVINHLSAGNINMPGFNGTPICGDENDTIDFIFDSTTGDWSDVDVSARITVSSAAGTIPTAQFDLTLD